MLTKNATPAEVNNALEEFLTWDKDMIREDPYNYFLRLKWMTYFRRREVVNPVLSFITKDLFALLLGTDEEREAYCRIVIGFFEVFRPGIFTQGDENAFNAWEYLEEGKSAGLPLDAFYMAWELSGTFHIFAWDNEYNKRVKKACFDYYAIRGAWFDRKKAYKLYGDTFEKKDEKGEPLFPALAYCVALLCSDHAMRLSVAKYYGAEHLYKKTKPEKKVALYKLIAWAFIIIATVVVAMTNGNLFGWVLRHLPHLALVFGGFFLWGLLFEGHDFGDDRTGDVVFVYTDNGGIGWGQIL